MRQDLQEWASGSASKFGGQWNEELHAILMRIDARSLGVSHSLLERVVTKEMVKLEGTTTGSRGYLSIERADWVRDGLEANLALQYDTQSSAGDRAFHLRSLSLMMRRLETLVASYLRQRLPTMEDGRVWSPVPALAQVLLARAWLRGVAQPGEPISLQLSGILSDETEADVGQQSRSAPWLDWLNKTNAWQAKMRDALRDLVALPTEGGMPGMINSGELVSSILRMNKSGKADPVPDFSGRLTGSLGAIGEARELATLWNANQSQIESVEFRQLRERANKIEQRLRNRSVSSHLERVDAAVTGASEILANKGMDDLQAWRTAYSEYLSKPLAVDDLEELIVAFDDEESIPKDLPERLVWLASHPAGGVMSLTVLLQHGERAIETMCNHANDVVGDGGNGSAMETIKAVGRAMHGASRGIKTETDAP